MKRQNTQSSQDSLKKKNKIRELTKLWFFQESCTDVRAGPQSRLSTKELMLSHCGAGEDLRVPRTARRSKQSTPKETNLEHSLEGLMLKPKLQYFGHLMQRADSLEKTLMLGKTLMLRRP